MLKKIVLSLMTFGLVVASAASTYKVTLFQPSVVAGAKLEAGEYKLEVKDNKVAIRSAGKQVAEAAVKVETADSKYASTSVRYKSGDGKFELQEIRLGGTRTRLVFD